MIYWISHRTTLTHSQEKAMPFWKKRNAPQPPKERVTVDETGKVTIRVRWDAPKTHPPKRVPPTDSAPRTR